MRTLVALLVAALALVGAASAWTSTEQLIYQYTKNVDMQAGQELGWLEGASSSAGFNSNTGYGYGYGYLDSSVWDIDAELVPVEGLTPDTENSVTQWGSSVLVTKAPDLENPAGIQFAGASKASQEVALSGNYNFVSADLGQYASVAICDWWSGDCMEAYASGYTTGSVSSGNDLMIEANIGQSTEVGFEQINAVGALPMMSGEQTAWAGFSGAYDANGDGIVFIDTFVNGDGYFDLYDW